MLSTPEPVGNQALAWLHTNRGGVYLKNIIIHLPIIIILVWMYFAF
jgi:hypothetical protein